MTLLEGTCPKSDVQAVISSAVTHEEINTEKRVSDDGWSRTVLSSIGDALMCFVPSK
ncbi:hypothetical protein PM082_018745 [Marasmius tenuissimus]|nr:hypothetical protein PM082_018745 [Marasmius tenuissimus]